MKVIIYYDAIIHVNHVHIRKSKKMNIKSYEKIDITNRVARIFQALSLLGAFNVLLF